MGSDSHWRVGIYRLLLTGSDGADSGARGTAFGIGPRVALTCHHCVDGFDPRSLVLRTAGSDCPLLQIAEVLFPEDPLHNDVAILRMSDDLPAWLPLSAEEPPEQVRLLGFGFPGSSPRQSLVRIEVDPRGVQPAAYAQYQLDVALILAGDPAAQGMSGGPIIEAESGTVIGMIVGGPDYGGRAIALPMWAVNMNERPWKAFDQALSWNSEFTEQRGWAMNANAAAALCSTQVNEAVERLSKRGIYDAARYIERTSFELALGRFLCDTKPAMLLTGAANVGKTSALSWFAALMSERAILLDGFQMDRLRLGLIDCIQEQLSKNSTWADGVEHVSALCQTLRDSRNGELVVLVDGLNESGASAFELRTWLSDAINQAAELGFRLVASCRSDHLNTAEIDDSLTTVFELGMFSESEAIAAAHIYGIEGLKAGVVDRHPLMFRIAARARDPKLVFQKGRYRAVSDFARDIVARCEGIIGSQVDSLIQGCRRVANHGEYGNESLDSEFVANQLGGRARLESLIEGGLFKAQDDRIRFTFDEVAAGLRSPLDVDRMQLGVLWRSAMADRRIATRVVNSLIASEAQGDEARFSDHVESLLLAIEDVVNPNLKGIERLLSENKDVPYLEGIASVVTELADALPNARSDIVDRVMSAFHAKFILLAQRRSSSFGLDSFIEEVAARLQIPWRQKAELLVQLVPMLTDSGLRTKDLFDRGGERDVKADAEHPTTIVGALTRLLLDHSDGMRRLLLEHLGDRRRLFRDGSPSGEVWVGELISSLILISASHQPKELIELLIARPNSDSAGRLLREVAASYPSAAMDCVSNYLDSPSALAVLKDVVVASLRSVGPGRAPQELIQQLRSILRDATADFRLLAASLIRVSEPDDLEAWDVLADAVALGESQESLRPVPAVRRQEYLKVLRGRADKYAIDEMYYENDAPLQRALASLAIEILKASGTRIGYAVGQLAEHKAFLIEKHSAFEPWREYLLTVAAHPSQDIKRNLIYLLKIKENSPSWQEELWSALLSADSGNDFEKDLVKKIVAQHDEVAPPNLMKYLVEAMQIRPQSTLQALGEIAEYELAGVEVGLYEAPRPELIALYDLVVEHIRCAPEINWPASLRTCEKGQAIEMFATHAPYNSKY
jgi:hypothetical protein